MGMLSDWKYGIAISMGNVCICLFDLFENNPAALQCHADPEIPYPQAIEVLAAFQFLQPIDLLKRLHLFDLLNGRLDTPPEAFVIDAFQVF